MVSCFFFSSRRRHTRLQGDWSSDVCSSDLVRRAGGDLARRGPPDRLARLGAKGAAASGSAALDPASDRSEEHTSELQSPCNLACRLLLEKKKPRCPHRAHIRLAPSAAPHVP